MQVIKPNSKEYKELMSHNMMGSKRVISRVRNIIEDIVDRGDTAVLEYTKKFDRVNMKQRDLKVSEREISASFQNVDSSLILALKTAIENATSFYKGQLPNNFKSKTENGKILEERYVPVERVGVYVPAGQVPLVSTVYNCAIPAIVAGVKEIVLVSPPNKDGFIDPFILATASMLKISEVYKIGGAQAVAALATGTKTVRKVDMVVGPGNEYVTEAKRQVFGSVGIDMLAGPSEVVVVVDANTTVEYVVADLNAQTEHHGGFGVVVVIDSESMVNKLKAYDISNAYIVSAKTREEAQDVVNDLAPEHLELLIDGARNFLKDIRNAGAVFINENTPVALGDYVAGPSHVLPTACTARFSSGLSVHDFLKRIHVIEYSKKALIQDAETLEKICKLEGMDMHLESVLVRLGRSVNDEKNEENS